MSKVLKASDYTHLFVDHNVLSLMEKDIAGIDELDFEDVNVMDRDMKTLANLKMDYGVEVKGLDSESVHLMESYIRKISEPDFETTEEFKDMFKAKFPEGHLCVWDKTLQENVLPNENMLSLVEVVGVEGNYVHFKLYKSHLMEPKHISLHGGMGSESLYKMESIHITEFTNKRIMFRNVKDEREELIVDLLKKS